ncbi:TPA: Dr family adhesin structural subunit [Escherichia coli]|nr:Dr family adhesin structural subunit [Escherichia coli]
MIKRMHMVGVMLCVLAGVTQAAELNLYMRSGLTGTLRDGERISAGRLMCRDAHTGFQVSLKAAGQGEQAGHYVVTGKNDSRHELRVRIEGNNWHTDEEGKGMMKSGTEEMVIFYIVADGQQKPAADSYVMQVSGSCIQPE